jgi:hypothetical protein
MTPRTFFIVAALATLVFALGSAPRSAVAQTFIDFEGPTYSPGFLVAPGPDDSWDGVDNVPQDNWQVQFGGPFYIDDYATAKIPWIPPSAGPQTFSPPPHPGTVFPGGLQFAGKGVNTVALLGTAQGGGRHTHSAPHAGLVEVSTDFINGPEHDFPLYQGAITSRGNPGNMAGIYTTAASTYVDPGQAPRGGNWAFSVLGFDVNGNIMNDDHINTTTFANWRFEQEGFDDLPRETWWRMGYVIDTDTRRITELKSMNLETGDFWNIINPQGDTETTLGIVLEDMYIRGGSAGADDLDFVGLYNVGNGQIHGFDNVYVGDPLDWVALSNIPEPSTVLLAVLGLVGMLGSDRRRYRS